MERYRQVVADLRRLLPGATLFTDIIVGFSGETDEQFANTRRAMEEFQYNLAFVAAYSPRPGAASSRWEDDIPLETKKARLQDLTQVLKTSSLAWNKAQVGKSMPVLVTGSERNPAYLAAYNEGRLPVRLALPAGRSAADFIGRFVEVRIVGAQALSLEGALLEPA